MATVKKTKEQMDRERMEEDALLARMSATYLEDIFPCNHDSGTRCRMRQVCYEGGRGKSFCNASGCKYNTAMTLRIYKPSFQDRNDADRFRNRLYPKALRDGLMTRDQLIGEAKLAGTWTEEDQDRISDLAEEIDNIISEQRAAKNPATKKRYQAKIDQLRGEQLALAIKFANITKYSIEQYLSDAEQSFLIVRCVKKIDASGDEVPVYESIDSLNKETNLEFIQRLTNACSAYWMGEGLEDFLFTEYSGDSQEEATSDSSID